MEEYTIKLAYPKINGEQPKEICISSENLYYTELLNLEGLQCIKDGESDEYKKIMTNCKEIAKLIKEIDELNSSKLPF
jgi:hypothetical protein